MCLFVHVGLREPWPKRRFDPQSPARLTEITGDHRPGSLADWSWVGLLHGESGGCSCDLLTLREPEAERTAPLRRSLDALLDALPLPAAILSVYDTGRGRLAGGDRPAKETVALSRLIQSPAILARGADAPVLFGIGEGGR